MKQPLKIKYDFLSFIEKTSFLNIFMIWIFLIIGFGLIYNFTSGFAGNLKTIQGNQVTGMFDYIYYSFITATSTGYGDITPDGYGMRIMAIANITIGMLMMAIVTSKLVSIKQERLLEKIYSLSFSEKFNRNISGLALFKGESDKLISFLKESEIIDRKTFFSLWMSFSALKSNMQELRKGFLEEKIFQTEKVIIEQILSGLDQIFENINSIVEIMESNDVIFKNQRLIENIYDISIIGIQIINKAKEEFPIYSAKVKDIHNNINLIQKIIMQFKIIDLEKDIEICIKMPFEK
jgi:hypothetical protein